jgi:hypothetical protein
MDKKRPARLEPSRRESSIELGQNRTGSSLYHRQECELLADEIDQPKNSRKMRNKNGKNHSSHAEHRLKMPKEKRTNELMRIDSGTGVINNSKKEVDWLDEDAVLRHLEERDNQLTMNLKVFFGLLAE